MGRFDYFVSRLKPNTTAVNHDNATFMKYCNGEISLQETKERFIYNNKMGKHFLIDDRDLADWLTSEGWHSSKATTGKKAILEIDMPNDCSCCPFRDVRNYELYCFLTGRPAKESKCRLVEKEEPNVLPAD